MNNITTVRIQKADISIEVSGDEKFVNKKTNELLEQMFSTDRKVATQESKQPTATATTTQNKREWADIYSIDKQNDTVKIYAREIPGDNKSEKTKNIARIVAYAKKGEWVQTSKIYEICKDFGCFDSANFASTIKSCDDFRFNGKGKSLEIKITTPGLAVAEGLFESITNNNKGQAR